MILFVALSVFNVNSILVLASWKCWNLRWVPNNFRNLVLSENSRFKRRSCGAMIDLGGPLELKAEWFLSASQIIASATRRLLWCYCHQNFTPLCRSQPLGVLKIDCLIHVLVILSLDISRLWSLLKSVGQSFSHVILSLSVYWSCFEI